MDLMKMLVIVPVVAAGIAATVDIGCAETAAVLPKGRFIFNVDYKHYLPWDKRYDTNGNVQNAAADFNGALDGRIFPSLALFGGPPFNIPAPNLGTTITSFEYSYERIEPFLGYGISDRLSCGVKVPYIWYKNDVKARLDTTTATVGLNPGFNSANSVGPTNLPLIPVAMGGRKLTTEDLQNLLGPGLPGLPGFGFKRFETWEEEGLGDIEAALKYQYYTSDRWRLAAGVGALFPTGKQEDIDNLVDQNLGGGSYAVLFRAYNDLVPAENLIFSTAFSYWLTLSQERERRISDPHAPLTTNRRKVTIDPGDVFGIETAMNYDFNAIPVLTGTSLELVYHYTNIFNSDIPDAAILEKETRAEEHNFLAKLFYSTVPRYVKKEFPVPMIAYVGYRNKFAGNNNSFRTQYIQAGLSIYF